MPELARRLILPCRVAALALAGALCAAGATAQTISSAGNQVFVVADPSTLAGTITITDNAVTPQITAGKDIRIHVPAAFNMTWDVAVTSVTIGGAAAGKVSATVTYQDGNRTVVLNVTTNFAAGDQITVAGLRLTSFTAPSATSNLWLEVKNDNAVTASDDKTILIVAPVLTGAANQLFSVGDASTLMTSNTITESATAPAITAAKDIRLRIPSTFNMVWNTGVTTATIGGGAAGKVSTAVSYEDAGKTLVLNVTANFAASDQITVSGLQFRTFSAPAAADRLQLVVSGAGGGTAATSDKTKQIYAAMTMSSAANQTFKVNAASTAMSQITITADATGTITAANDIRIRIPATLSMTWDTSLLTVTRGGGAAGKVSATVSYEDGGMTLVVNVTSDFAPGDVLTLSALKFKNFTAASPPEYLQLVVSGAGGATAVTDDKTKTINGVTIASAANQIFRVGDPATLISPITITDAAPPLIKNKKDLQIHIPAGFNMTWDASITTATITGSGAGKVSTTVSYLNANKTLFVQVNNNFGANDQIVISGLKFTTFSAPSAINYLWVEVNNDGLVSGTDDQFIQIIATTYGASVTPDTVRSSRMPSNGTNYTQAFTVTNSGNITDSYDLLTTRRPGTALSVVSITGAGVTQGANPDSARLASLAAGGSAGITVTYSVGNVAGGSKDTLLLKARSVGSSSQWDDGRLEVTVIRPALSITKEVTPTGTQSPGTDLAYTITFDNVGSAGAQTVVLVDTLSTAVQFQIGSVVNNMPSGVSVTVEYSNNAGSTWTYVPASAACGGPAGYDRCVNRVRWRLLNPLSATPPDNVGSVSFIASIR